MNTCTEGESPVQKHLALEESLIQVVEYKTHMLEAQVQGMSPVSREIILACEHVLAAIV